VTGNKGCVEVAMWMIKDLLENRGGRASLFAHTVPLDQCTRAPVHTRRILFPGLATRPSPDCLLIVYQCTRAPVHTRRILLPGLAARRLTVCSYHTAVPATSRLSHARCTSATCRLAWISRKCRTCAPSSAPLRWGRDTHSISDLAAHPTALPLQTLLHRVKRRE
jgi:hypothetical protein